MSLSRLPVPSAKLNRQIVENRIKNLLALRKYLSQGRTPYESEASKTLRLARQAVSY